MPEEEIIIAIDPGIKKCGYAVVDSTLSVLQREVISTEKIAKTIEDSLNIYKINKIILGNGTNYKNIEERLKNHFLQLKIILIEEDFSTLEARKKYFEAHPPRGILKIIPLSLRVPPCHYDDFVAVILAEKYFRNNR
ncbi:MAG: Holliday junction resolvase RuvX [bacterium]|nr:Holliday junction resolvase RuvX [bacterium]MBU1428646.1 Holliday junction resolvase RuvX [bacterium]MBU2440440.1 Holliday junction resolvase RuvX [bacterium]